MKVKIEDNYTRAELEEIIAALIDKGVITSSEVYSETELQTLSLNFFDLPQLLYPAGGRLVAYSIDDRKGWFDQSETTDFYVWFTLQLLRGCELNMYSPSCSFEAKKSSEKDLFVLKAGHLSSSIYHKN